MVSDIDEPDRLVAALGQVTSVPRPFMLDICDKALFQAFLVPCTVDKVDCDWCGRHVCSGSGTDHREIKA